MPKQKKAVDLPVAAGTWRRVLNWEEEPVLNLSLRWPRLPEDRAGPRRINRCYQRLSELWRGRWEGPLYREACAAAAAARAAGRPFSPWEAVLDFTVTFRREGLLSLRLDAREETGGPRGVTVRHADTWESASGTPRTLSSFFPPRSRWRRQVLRALEAQAQARVDGGETLYDEDWRAKLAARFDPDRFYLTGEGIAIFYPLYAIAPYAEGIPVFLLPLPAGLSEKSDQENQEKS